MGFNPGSGGSKGRGRTPGLFFSLPLSSHPTQLFFFPPSFFFTTVPADATVTIASERVYVLSVSGRNLFPPFLPPPLFPRPTSLLSFPFSLRRLRALSNLPPGIAPANDPASSAFFFFLSPLSSRWRIVAAQSAASSPRCCRSFPPLSSFFPPPFDFSLPLPPERGAAVNPETTSDRAGLSALSPPSPFFFSSVGFFFFFLPLCPWEKVIIAIEQQ